jgi:hypothetical protein
MPATLPISTVAVSKALSRTVKRITHLKQDREEHYRALTRLRQQVEMWENPRALLEMLQSWYDTQGKQSYKGVFPMAP